jgi:predicted O-methyltransferase YrrM
MTAYPAPREAVPPDAAPTTDRFGRRAMRWGVISQLVRENGWTEGVEIGTADGRCSEAVLEACPDLRLTTVDVWAPQTGHDGPEDWANWPHAPHEATARARLARYADRCTIVKGYSAVVAETFAPASLDFVFLDGDHGEAGVRADIAAWRPKIRPGGMLLGHDAAWAGVRAAIDDLCPGYWIGPNDVWGVSVAF